VPRAESAAAARAPGVREPRVAIPLPFVVAGLPVTLPPPVSEPKVTLAPETAFPNASVANADGAVATLVPTRATWLLPPFTARFAGAAALTVTAAVWVIAVPPAVAVMVLAWAVVELKAVVNAPLALLVPDAGAKLLPVPVAADVTAAPVMGLL